MTVLVTEPDRSSILSSLRANWRVYAIDGALLGIFMISACSVVALMQHPGSPVHRAIVSSFTRRAIIGIAMGLTALCLIYSPWGKRSGAFMNPAMTIGFLRLGKLAAIDATFYIVAQFIGATIGVQISSIALGMIVSHRSVNFAATVPGTGGLLFAWIGEFAIAFVLISAVIVLNRHNRLTRFTGCVAATLVALFITFEAPLSGMSFNPARTFGSALFANEWTGWWIYHTAPILGMLAGIEVQRVLFSKPPCGKWNHSHICFVECDCVKEHRHDT
jgi:aquaporin Z